MRSTALTLPFFACVLLAVLAGCRPAPDTGPVPDAVVSPATWELAYADDELGGVIRGVILEPVTTVVDPERIPCPDATVELWAPTPDGQRLERRLAESRTDAQGRFEVVGAPLERWVLRAHKDGYGSAIAGHQVSLDGALGAPLNQDLEFWLRPAREVHGRCVDTEGRPLAGEKLWASSLAYLEEATTDAEGRFVFHAPSAPCELFRDGQRVGPHRTFVDVPETGAVPEVEFVRRSSAQQRGQVRMGPDGPPVAQATVMVVDRPAVRVSTDAEGRFVIAARPGEWIAAFAHGAGWRSAPVPPAGDVELRLGPASRMHGTVTGKDGRPLADVRIFAVVPRLGGGLDRVWGPRTGADGRFDFTWLPRPTRTGLGPTAVLAVRRGEGVSEALVFTDEPPDGEVALVLQGEAALTGRLTRSDGSAAEHAVVVARWSDAKLPAEYASRTGLLDEEEARIASDGTYRLDGVPHGLGAVVEVNLSGWIETLELDPGAHRDRPQVVDFQAPQGKAISGRVTSHAHLPLPPGGHVFVTRLGIQDFEVRREALLTADGSFVLEDIPPGRYQITANVAGYQAGGATAEAGESDVEIIVEKRSEVTVRAIFPEAARLPPAVDWVVLLTGGIQTRRKALDPGADWSVTFDRVWPGEYDIEVVAGPWRGRRDDVVIPDGEHVTYEIPVEPTLSVDAILVDAAGQPVPGLQLVANPRGIEGAKPQVLRSGPDGRFTVTGLLPGRWVLQASPQGRASLYQPIDIPLESAIPLRVPLPAHGTLRIDASGESFADAIVALVDEAGEPVSAWGPDAPNLGFRFRLPESGVLEIRGVRCGAVRVELSGGRLKEPREQTVQVDAGGTHAVPFE